MKVCLKVIPMIAITKEFKQLVTEMFDARGTTEIPANDLVDVLSISVKELEVLLKDDSLKDEFKLVQAKDGTLFVKRYLHETLDVVKLANAFKIQWDNIGGCPCFTCYELEKCDIGNPISSVDCPLFTRWLFAKPIEEKDD